MRREIDPQSSPRGRAFELWKNAAMPKVTITKTFNISRLVKAGRRRGLKTNMLMCWCIGHAATPSPSSTPCLPADAFGNTTVWQSTPS